MLTVFFRLYIGKNPADNMFVRPERWPTKQEWGANVNAIKRNGLLLIPRVTDMGNGMFRPEVVYCKGRASDIVFGEMFDHKLRAQLLASLAARSAVMDGPQLRTFWTEMDRAVFGCHRHVEALAAAI